MEVDVGEQCTFALCKRLGKCDASTLSKYFRVSTTSRLFAFFMRWLRSSVLVRFYNHYERKESHNSAVTCMHY